MPIKNAQALKGTSNADIDATQNATKAGTTTNTSQDPRQNALGLNEIEVTCASVNVAEGEKVLCTYVLVSNYDNNSQTGGMNHQLQRDGASIANFSHGNYSGNCLKFTAQYIDDPGVGNYVYRIQQTDSSNLGGYQFIFLKVNVIKLVDTHKARAKGIIL